MTKLEAALLDVTRLDREYLWPRVRQLAAGLGRPEIVDFLTRALQKADARSPGDRLDG